MIEQETTEALSLTNSVIIEIHTASFRVTRGYTLAAALCDEVAFWRDDSGANPDTEILQALRPGLSSIPGAMLLIASSPYAKRGVLYSSYRRHYGDDASRVLVWKAGTAAMNPRIDPAIIEQAVEADPQSAAAEYFAEFRDDISGFVTRETVDACTALGRMELPPMASTDYVAFVDPSGGSSDSMTMAVAHLEDDRPVLDLVREIKAPFSPDKAVEEFASVLRAYGISKVVGDRYAGAWVGERFSVHNLQYEPSEKPKSALYIELLPLLTGGRAELLDVPRLISQLVALERRTARGGRDSVDHVPGAHDDLANAAAGALVLAAQKDSLAYDLLGAMGISKD